MRYRFAPDARQEFIDAVQWYLVEAGSTIAEHFDWAVDRALGLLVIMPGIGTRSYPGVRTWALKVSPTEWCTAWKRTKSW